MGRRDPFRPAGKAGPKPRPDRRVVALLAATLWALASPWHYAPAAGAAAPPRPEHEVKADQLVRFPTYVDWPAGTFANPNDPVQIGILGADPFGPYIDKVAADIVVKRKGANRKIVIRRGNQLEDLKDCHVLFLARAEAARAPQVLAAVGNRGVLTVSENVGFAQRGGILNFVIPEKTVRFELNQEVGEGRGFGFDPLFIKLSIPVKNP